MPPLRWINIKCSWTSLRAVGNSPVAKLTIIIPLVGYLLIFNEKILHYLELSQRLFGAQQPLPGDGAHISTRLLSIYFGLCFIAVASSLYAAFCPREIKRHSSAPEYIGVDGERMSIIEWGAIEHSLTTADTFAQKQLSEFRGRENSRPIPETHEEQLRRLRLYEGGVLDIYFNYLDRKYPTVRIATGTLFCIGFGALLIPSVEVFVQVAKMLYRALASTS